MTREIGFRLVDVFAPRPLEGNQLCVVSDPGDLDHDRMLDVAREIAFSETTFVSAVRPDGYDVRIFTPDAEIPFAGHPTLGTAYVLAADGRIGPTATQVSVAGEVPVEVDVASSFAWMTQMPPVFAEPFDDRELLARASGLRVDDLHPDLPAQVVTTGLPPLIVPIRDVETLRRARIDQAAVAEACDGSAAEELYLFAVGRDAVTARFFGPTPAIVEDPATGSAAGPLGAYLAEHGVAGMPGRVLVLQGEQVGRPSELHVEVEPGDATWSVRVGGGVHAVGHGVFEI
ncbi:MAG TPA: PhzF family phenazine biosynthesis protein [Actinomycetota bacterium]|nr:PhzF family phenazine biosynthesis protein [Actinomycetota bacterium]